MRGPVWIIALLTGCGAGLAEEIDTLPRFPVESVCSEKFAGRSAAIGHCIETEQGRYNNLKLVWENVSRNDRERCSSFAGKQPMWNYTYLSTCVSTALDRAKIEQLKRPNEFRY